MGPIYQQESCRLLLTARMGMRLALAGWCALMYCSIRTYHCVHVTQHYMIVCPFVYLTEFDDADESLEMQMDVWDEMTASSFAIGRFGDLWRRTVASP